MDWKEIWPALLLQKEFWSAIAGAVVGGGIAYLVQIKALREARRTHEADHKRAQDGLGNSLLFKTLRIHSDCWTVHRYLEDSFETARQRGFSGKPWQFVLPLANPPDAVHFSSDEMGMLLSLKNDKAFNMLAPMDMIHNSLIEAMKVLSSERRALAGRLRPDEASGNLLSGTIDRAEMMALRPQMIEINDLIENLRSRAKRDFEESDAALDALYEVMRDKLGVIYKLERKHKSTNAPT